ncbi:TolC family protein [Pedobacter montanisoli]|uniref:TolC family protein n=1 Tax=Pedobacter montanisoli TaxID=2923277 RepID=A0ABT0A033_9SPHI|nr:TolC family protein [Pedobacter montanisoli]MCJ0743922.1 TolC family protein [Pedobacter montanisoli]
MKKLFTTILILCFSGLPVLHAQQVRISKSLKQAIDAAISQSTDLTNHYLETDKMELERKSVLSKYIPTVSANAMYGYFNNTLSLDIPTLTLPLTGINLFSGDQKFENNGNLLLGGVTAKAILFSGGQILNGAKALDAKKKGTDLMAEPKKDAIIKDVINSFDQIRLLNEAKKLIDESEVRLKKETERVEKAIANGLAIPYDRDKIKLAMLELSSKRFEIEGKHKVLYQKISMVTHYNEAQIDSVVYDLEPIVLTDGLNTENRSELKALAQFKNAYEYALKKEKGSLLPNLGAFGNYSYASVFDAKSSFSGPITGNNYKMKLNSATLSPSFVVGVALKWDIFSGFERKHKIDEAKINIRQIENQISDSKEKMQLQLQNNNVQYETLLKQIEVADQREKIAKNNLNMAQKQYSAGLINVTERLTAETDIYQVSLNKITNIVEQRKMAIETLSSTGNLQNAIQVK